MRAAAMFYTKEEKLFHRNRNPKAGQWRFLVDP
jgi:ribosomal protein L24E